MMSASNTEPYFPDATVVAEQNDTFRREQFNGNSNLRTIPGMTVCTPNLYAYGREFLAKVQKCVTSFDTFEPDNDPDGYHDFGLIEIEGISIYFKIDMYEADGTMRWGAEQPDNLATTFRVLTLMLASDW